MQAKKRSKNGRKPAPGAARTVKRKSPAAAKLEPRVARVDPTAAAASRRAPDASDLPIEQVIFPYINRIARERDIDKLMLLLADFGRDLIGVDRCTVWLCNEKEGTLWSKVAHGVGHMSIPKTKGIAGWVATHGEPLIINDVYSDERFDKEVDKSTGYRTRSMLSLPIKDADDRTVGVYQAVNKLTGSGAFSDLDKDHLLLASTYTAEVLKTALMQEEIQATQREVILLMAEAGEERSKETGNHVRRVAEYCRLFAEKHRMTEAETEMLRWASPMHDIGKIGIPDSILQKPGKLDKAEWDKMQTHAVRGYRMLGHFDRPLLKAAAIIAWQHHEKWNGSGYPCGLAREAIHIYGRITALADVFDALASDRVYKKAWEFERIVKLFEEEKEKHFDPDLAKIFLENVDEFVKIRNMYRDETEGASALLSCPEQ